MNVQEVIYEECSHSKRASMMILKKLRYFYVNYADFFHQMMMMTPGKKLQKQEHGNYGLWLNVATEND